MIIIRKLGGKLFQAFVPTIGSVLLITSKLEKFYADQIVNKVGSLRSSTIYTVVQRSDPLLNMGWCLII